MKKIRLVVATSAHRPQMGQDLGLELLRRLSRGCFEIVAVIGPNAEASFGHGLHLLGIKYLTLNPQSIWESSTVGNLEEIKADLGLDFFGETLSAELLALPRLGWAAFHSAPLPELAGPLPEAFAILHAKKSLQGVVYQRKTNPFEGPLLLSAPKTRITPLDTPDSLKQRLTSKSLATISKALKQIARGKTKPVEQTPATPLPASYQNFYPASFINWKKDSHDMIRRRFRVFLGQNHLVALKSEIDGQIMEHLNLELHACPAPGKPGEIIASLEGRRVIRTTEGVCVLLEMFPFHRSPKISETLDHTNLNPLQARKPRPIYSLSRLKRLWDQV